MSSVGSGNDLKIPEGRRITSESGMGGQYNPYASRIKGGPRQLNVTQGGHFGDYKPLSAGTAQEYAYANILETNPLDYTYDYSDAGFGEGQLNQLRDIFRPMQGVQDDLTYTIENNPNERELGSGLAADRGWFDRGVETESGQETYFDDVGTKENDFLQYTNLFDPYAVAQMLSLIRAGQKGEWGVEDEILGGEVQAFTEMDFARMDKTFYDPIEQKGRGTILAQILNNMKQRKNTGFAGSGARDDFLTMQRQGFNESMADILAEIVGKETEATENVQKKIDTFRQLLT